MKSRSLGALVLVVVALAAARPGTLLAQAIQRSLYVSVLDDAGAPVQNLGPSDFIVREDNVAREILRVAPAETPMQVAVLVDNSTAMRDHIRDIREAVSAFVSAMVAAGAPKHEVAIIGIADRPTILTDYTSDRTKLMKGVGRIFSQPMSGTYLLDAIIETANGLRKREAARPVIVAIITESIDYSNRYHDQAVDALRQSGAAFHAIVLGPPGGNISTTEARERAITLDEGTRVTGGRYDNVLAATALPGRLKQVADELLNQYVVTYARPQSLIPPERVTVSAARAGLMARGTPVNDQRAQGRP
jgi:VWFA-related protein